MRIDLPSAATNPACPFTGYNHSLRHRSLVPPAERRAAPDAALAPFGPLVGVQPIRILRREHPLVTRARRASIWIDRITWAVVIALGLGIFARAAWALIQRSFT